MKYAFPASSGLRRKELAEVRWGDLHLDSVISYIQLRSEQTKMGEAIALPLHPFLATELGKLPPGMAETLLFSFLPEGRTMLRDLIAAGVTQADASGRRADFHALRHTFAKRLDATGCSHATRRALMRQGGNPGIEREVGKLDARAGLTILKQFITGWMRGQAIHRHSG